MGTEVCRCVLHPPHAATCSSHARMMAAQLAGEITGRAERKTRRSPPAPPPPASPTPSAASSRPGETEGAAARRGGRAVACGGEAAGAASSLARLEGRSVGGRRRRVRQRAHRAHWREVRGIAAAARCTHAVAGRDLLDDAGLVRDFWSGGHG